MSDAYTKIMLTLGVGALMLIAFELVTFEFPTYEAIDCGGSENYPCHIQFSSEQIVSVQGAPATLNAIGQFSHKYPVVVEME